MSIVKSLTLIYYPEKRSFHTILSEVLKHCNNELKKERIINLYMTTKSELSIAKAFMNTPKEVGLKILLIFDEKGSTYTMKRFLSHPSLRFHLDGVWKSSKVFELTERTL